MEIMIIGGALVSFPLSADFARFDRNEKIALTCAEDRAFS
jgi:hypothetical protein